MARSSLTWPEHILGCPMRASFGGEVEPQWLRSTVEDGAARYRRTRIDQRFAYELAFTWTGDELQVWERLYLIDLDAGTKWFRLALPFGGGPVAMDCHLAGPWRYTQIKADLFQVSFAVEALFADGGVPPYLAGETMIDGGTPALPSEDILDGLYPAAPAVLFKQAPSLSDLFGDG